MSDRFDPYVVGGQQQVGIGTNSPQAPVAYNTKSPRELTEVAVAKAKARLEWLQLQINSVGGWQDEHQQLVKFVKKLEGALVDE